MLAVVHAGAGRAAQALEILENLKKEGASVPCFRIGLRLFSTCWMTRSRLSIGWKKPVKNELVSLRSLRLPPASVT